MKLLDLLKETRVEMKHVTWPKTNVAVGYTVLVIIICIVIALFLGFFDYIFGILLQEII